MPRRSRQDDATPGHDSFLDIVSNIVGILIILVLVTGVRVKNYGVEAATSGDDVEIEARLAKLDTARNQADARHREVLELNRQIDEVEALAKLRDRQRMALATAAEALRRKVQERRQQLDSDGQERFELDRQVSEAETRLAQLQSAKTQLESSRPDAIVVKALPTPLARTVRGAEAHFQLSGKRIAWVPLDLLLEEFKQDARAKATQLLSMPELTETIGPFGGFRLRYTLERREMSPELAMASGGGQYARLRRWTLIPTSSALGEPVDQALKPNSQFHRRVASLPRNTTITIWTYDDSFAEFRRVKEELFALGFDTAGRPLPDGVPIGGSPDGNRSAAQ